MKTTDERKKALLESFKNGLIVSCQVILFILRISL